MKKNNFLKLIISLFLISFLFIINSCREELTAQEDKAIINREADFFKNAESQLNKVNGGSQILNILKEENQKNHFVSKLSDQKGLPIWDKMIIDKSFVENKDGESQSEQRILLPLTEDDIFMSSYVVVAINQNDEVTLLENPTNKKLYEFIHNKSISRETRETVLSNIIFANYKAFGYKKFINIPEDLFSRVPLDSGKTTKTIQLVDEDKPKGFNKSTSSREMLMVCITYQIPDASCSCHGTYIDVTECSYIYAGGGMGSGSGTGSGNTGGGSNGGGGSGTTTNNTPWYLMNPNIDIYTYNSNVRAVFKSLTDFGIILEKEHVDYLQPKTTLTTTVKNCLTNNTGYKSVFIYSMLDEYAFAYPALDANILNNKLTYLYNKMFAINPQTNWLEFWDAFSANENVAIPLLTELSNDWSNPDIVKPTLRFKNNTRLNCIFNKAKTSANFKQYLTNFDSRFSVAHLQFDVKSLPSSTNAQTNYPIGYWIKIDINSNNLNRPTLDIARTLMHEIIHAEMFRILLSIAPTSNGQIDVVQLKAMLNARDYPGIYDYYRRYGVNNMQHEQMAAHFRGIIKNFLKQIDGSITDVQAESMAWVGLQGTVAWNNLGSTNQNNILNTYNNWYNSATHSCP